MSDGWISLHRKIRENPIWKERPFSRGQAWIDLILRANHKDNQFLLGNEFILCKKGQFYTSESKLSIEWGWSRKKVARFFKCLEGGLMVSRKCTNKWTRITITNYGTYQETGAAKAPVRHRSGTGKAQVRHTNNNDNNENKKNTTSSSEHQILCEKICSLWGFNRITPNEFSRVGGIAKNLLLKKATPELLEIIKKRHETCWPDVFCSPESVLKHWDTFMKNDIKPKSEGVLPL